MDEGTLHMARAMAGMSIHEEDLYSVVTGIKSDMTVVGKMKMQDKLQGFRFVCKPIVFARMYVRGLLLAAVYCILMYLSIVVYDATYYNPYSRLFGKSYLDKDTCILSRTHVCMDILYVEKDQTSCIYNQLRLVLLSVMITYNKLSRHERDVHNIRYTKIGAFVILSPRGGSHDSPVVGTSYYCIIAVRTHQSSVAKRQTARFFLYQTTSKGFLVAIQFSLTHKIAFRRPFVINL
ncbi:hypothetical protein QTP88_024464 [Uroleucon formosanum]